MNRDPITKQPGSHPVGTGLGAAGGAATGALIGGVFGPIGMLVGGGAGAIAGGAAGHAIGEQVNPTGEVEYWRNAHTERNYYDPDRDYEQDYLPAYQYGWEARSRYADRDWDDDLETELRQDWDNNRYDSSLGWEHARYAVKDSWDRTDNTYRAYGMTDDYWESRYMQSDYYESDYDFNDYRPAYRYGTYARSYYPEDDWDDRLERKLKREWDDFKGDSRLAWEKAKHATRDAWHSVERMLPGDFDNDGR